MFLWMKKSLIVPAIIFVILAALFFVSPVSADDGAPVDTTVPPEVVATDAPVVETPTEAGEATTEETPSPTAEPVDEAASLPETLEELAESGIALVDASGETLTVPTRSSGNVVVNGDPYFNIGSVRYYFMKTDQCGTLTNCQESASPIQHALAYMAANSLTPTDRKLYITADTYDEYVEVDGSLPGVSGLTGLVGVLETGETAEDVVINGHLYIHNMSAGFSVSNMTVINSTVVNDAAIWAYYNTGTLTLTDVNVQATEEDSSGIIVTNHNGGVVLNRVTSNGNAYKGAEIQANGPVTILNSTFDENLQDVNNGLDGFEPEPVYAGLNITEYTAAAVTLNGVTAINNVGDGVDISASTSTITVRNGEFTDNNQDGLVGNWGDGLWLVGNIVTLENINANNNGMRGIMAQANTSVAGTRLYMFYNDEEGFRANTCWGWNPMEQYCHNTGAGTVTLTTVSGFDNNYDGFYIYSKGLVTISDLYAGLNSNIGLFIDNQDATSPAAVNLTRVTADTNENGINIHTRGAVTGKNVVANGNTFDGMNIESIGTAPITFTIDAAAPEKFNQTENNSEDGLYITTLGAVSLTSFSANGNSGNGVYIDNYSATTAMPVTITVLAPTISTNTYTENDDGGLVIYSRGAVTLKYIDASNNQNFGADISNLTPVGAPGALVSISDSSFNWNCNHDDMGCYWSGDTHQYGLEVDSKGAITLLNVEANGNYGFGATLENYYPGATGAVSINAGAGRSNSFSGNGDTGLIVTSNGAITTTNLDVSYNDGAGARLRNDFTGMTGGVTLNAGTGMANYFENNAYDGVNIRTNGAVTATNIAANYTSDGYGVVITNASGSGAVTIKQVLNTYFGGNTFNVNSAGGLRITSNGAVTVTYGGARNNSNGNGVYISNSGGIGAVTVTATGYDSNSNNGFDGIKVLSRGNITLNGIHAMNNGDTGADLQNEGGTGSVTINNGYFDGNFFGLYLRTSGAVIWKNGSASDNYEGGAEIRNNLPLVAGKPVTITNVATNGNGETGLYVDSKGVVTLTQVESYGNSANYYWLYMGDSWIDNMSDNQTWYFTAPGSGEVTVDVSSINFDPSIDIYDGAGSHINGADGAMGSVSLTTSGLTSGETYYIRLGTNTWDGDAYQVDIFEGSGPFSGSFNDYLSEANGVYVDNSAGAAAAVTFTNPTWSSWIANNSGSNVQILSSGVITLSNMDLNNSAQYGLDVNNAGAVATPAITITGVNFGWNDASGAWIRSKGAVTIKNSDASQNGGSLFGWGYDIQNNFGTIATPVSLTNTYAYGNTDDGIYIRSNGAVTLNTIASNNNGVSGIDIQAMGVVTLTNIQANDNADYGAIIMTAKDLIINKPATGANNFDDNGYTGLRGETAGKVTITRVRASGNDGNGVYIEVHNLLGTSPVVMTDIITSDNTAGTGTEIVTAGAVTITSLAASNNSDWGLDIFQGPTSPAGGRFAIALSKIATSGNGFDGISVESLGNITLSKFESSFNDNNGVYLNNTAGNGTVTILNPAGGASANTAFVNGWVGVVIESNGAVNVTGLETSSNTLDGLVIDNSGSTTSAVVNLTSVRSRFNGVDGIPSSTGIYVTSKGLVTINSSWVSDNQADGIYIRTPKNTVINNTASINNDLTGMFINLTNGILTPGNLTLNGCFWFGNLRNDPYIGDTNLIFTGGTLTIL